MYSLFYHEHLGYHQPDKRLVLITMGGGVLMKNLSILFVGLMLSGTVMAQVSPVLYSCTSDDNLLRTIDTADGSTAGSIEITIPGGSVNSCTGLATNPETQELTAILKFTDDSSSGFDRGLATINPTTGVATVKGNFNTGFAGLAFSCEALYGVTGNGATPSETLFTVDPNTAAVSEVLSLGAGDDGEAIGFNPADGLMYHASGHTGDCAGDDDGVCFESINLSTLAISNINISGGALTNEEAQALTWWDSAGEFLWKQDHGTGPLFSVTTGGSASLIGDMDHQAKGLAFVPVEFPDDCSITGVKKQVIPVNNKWALTLLLVMMMTVGMGYLRKHKSSV
jgi:hypothetical protein